MEAPLTLHPFGDDEYVAVFQPGDVIRHLSLCPQAKVIAQLGAVDADELVHQALELLLESWEPEQLPEDLDLAELAIADPAFLPALRTRLAD
ncbi:hypothetical protein [Fodinicola acaciae]|uniref:hypothetical protein n=1 Tax=Fodinicola acaciae TaxID=2681555 RepID=UPI0013D412B8|nr:hypothetical protein [Fodinicola acaciae]